MKSDNLIPNSERTHEQLVAMGRKGGIASGKARREKKERIKDLQAVVARCTYDELIGAYIAASKTKNS